MAIGTTEKHNVIVEMDNFMMTMVLSLVIFRESKRRRVVVATTSRAIAVKSQEREREKGIQQLTAIFY